MGSTVENLSKSILATFLFLSYALPMAPAAPAAPRPLIVAFEVLYSYVATGGTTTAVITVAADTADDARADAETTLAILPDLRILGARPAPCGLYAL